MFSAQRLVAAVIRHDGGAPTVAFLIDLRERTQVARLVLLVIAMFIGDVVIVSPKYMFYVLRWMRADCSARRIVYGSSGASSCGSRRSRSSPSSAS